jgi:hypothetical protein
MSRFRAPNALVGISLIAVLAAACTAIFTKPTSDRIRKRIVDIAVRESKGTPRVSTYWREVLKPADQLTPPKDWCGAFVLWVLHTAGIALDTKWAVGSGFLSHLPITKNPKPGDVAYLAHLQHHALVTGDNGNEISLMNGNGFGGLITPSTMQRSAITAFYSIDPYLQQAIG